MTSTAIGLPDRYRPLEQVGPDEPTATGVIHCWRAKDRVLNRDVAIRVHTPAGPAAHDWISRALTAGGLATPALAMVYDASEGTGDPQSPGGAAYVVNEWIEGETLTERLARGPIPDRELRTVLRRLADGVAEAHRVGLAVGGLTADNVVLRPNGLVGLRAVPAATGSTEGDIAALGALLEICLTGLAAGDETPRRLTGPPDLVALVRRTRSTDPSQGLSSAAAMAALLAERPRTGPTAVQSGRGDDVDGSRRRRLRDRRTEAAVADDEESADAGFASAPPGLPPVPARPVTGEDTRLTPAALGGDTIDAGSVAPRFGAYAGRHSGPPTSPTRAAGPPPGTGADDADAGIFDVLPAVGPDGNFSGTGYTDELGSGAGGDEKVARHRAVVVGFWLLALLVVAVLAWYVGSSLMSVASSVGGNHGSTPPVTGSSSGSSAAAPPAAGAPLKIVTASVFDPQGDGQSENARQAPLSYDGNPSTAWKTLDYRGSAQFGNLKKGVGLVYDLGSAQKIASVTVSSTQPGATVEIRTGSDPQGSLDSFATDATGTIQGATDLRFAKVVSSRYVLVWITGLVPSNGTFSADLAEVAVHAAG